METQFELVLLLLAIAAGITAVAKKFKQPYPIALVVIGVIIGILPFSGLEELKHTFAEDEIFHFAIISIFLPTLLGEATLNLPYSHLKQNKLPILLLAVVGTMITFVTAGWMTAMFLGLSIQAALVFAALMAPTDPISVLSIFKSMGVNHRISTVMEGESLINDGLAVVLFTIAAYQYDVILSAGSAGIGIALGEFLKVVLGGLLVGGAFGYFFSRLTTLFDDYPLEIVFSMLLFYGSFFVAEAFHVSGVIAVVVAGLIFGNYGKKVGMSPTTSLSIRTFWDVASLVANTLVFLLVGLEITRMIDTVNWLQVLIAIGIVVVARSIAVYSTVSFVRSLPKNWKHIFNWGGLKGSLSLALALSLPVEFEYREEILMLAFGVVFFSLIVQGLTIKPLVGFLGEKATQKEQLEYDRIQSRIYRYHSGRKQLEKMAAEGTLSSIVYNRLVHQYDVELKELNEKLESLYEQEPELRKETTARAIRNALYAEHEALEELETRHLISDQVTIEEKRFIRDLLEREEMGENVALHSSGEKKKE
ncbi:Na+/H+ antiporter [Pseudalkalibacillus berkeleyi]|uniref:Na+/H+ antiporter n=1 Tax=Pseudalkalibacillus berkeleyi TaxID=1069813 RepID=A0ABS9H011_9BACL|nr:Na+/H+ antiporter [Pseudalkalibacillus berkeleyi]MCF6137256.1 Na+/H+ antiporter [Pseudalkalibacillus berkeleyi]